jgi:hypothetical protein
MAFVSRFNPSFCPERKKGNMQLNTANQLPKDFGCSRPCTCNECKLLYVDNLTFFMKTHGEKREEFIAKIISILCFPYLYWKAIRLGKGVC